VSTDKRSKVEEKTAFENFADFTKRLVAVPKKEIEEQEADYKKRRESERRSKANGKH
jgi:hypothetical protein